jgi:hypothetical protein
MKSKLNMVKEKDLNMDMDKVTGMDTGTETYTAS